MFCGSTGKWQQITDIGGRPLESSLVILLLSSSTTSSPPDLTSFSSCLDGPASLSTEFSAMQSEIKYR